MITFEAPYSFQNDDYDPNDVGLQDSPPLKPFKPKLQPTPSPPPDGSESDEAKKLLPSEEDAVLIDHLGDGKAPKVVRTAARELLASDDEIPDESEKEEEEGLSDELCRACKEWAKQNGKTDYSRQIGRDSHCPMCRLVSFNEFWEPSTSVIKITKDLFSGIFRSSEYPLGTTFRYVIEQGATVDATGKLITDRTINVTQIRKWLEGCKEAHPECHRPQLPHQEFERHLQIFRVVDVIEERIVEASMLQRYLTLSYVWGQIPTLMLQKRNLLKLTSPGGLRSFHSTIPCTIKDAMELCRLLNERYLWVDTLCLIQDDLADIAVGVHGMNHIYEHSYLNIIAATGENAEAGLPGVQENSRCVTQQVVYLKPGMSLVLTHELIFHLKRSKYFTRGWTYQEQHFAKRSLVFINQQVYFKCQRLVWSEDKSDGLASEENLDAGDLMYVVSGPDAHPFDCYQVYLLYYSQRQFTREDDVLKAFTGILNSLASRMKCKFLQGLPNSCFDACLLFVTAEYRPGDSESKRRHEFPIWSWAGWKLKVGWDNTANFLAETDWLDCHTWITFYVNFPHSTLNYRDDIWSSYISDLRGRRREKLWLQKDMIEFQQLSPEYLAPRTNRVVPWVSILENGKLPTEPSINLQDMQWRGRDYPLLQFWTMTAMYSMSSNSDGSFCIHDKNLHRCGLVDLDSRLATNAYDPSLPHKFLILSESQGSRTVFLSSRMISYEPVNFQDATLGQRYKRSCEIEERQDDHKWNYYSVMPVIQDAAGVYERIGIGQIYQSSLEMSHGLGPQWEEIVLG